MAVGPVTIPPAPNPTPAPAQGSPLQEAETLDQNWGKWNMHTYSQGGSTNFAAPPSNAPQDEKDAIQYFNVNTTLYNAIIAENGGDPAKDPLTKADLDKFVSNAKSDATAADPNYKSSWDSVQGLSDQQKSDLDKPIQAAQDLVQNWHAWGFASGASFGSIPSDLPQSAKDTLNYIENNPAMMKAIGAGDGGKSSTITEKDVENFLGKAENDAKAGASAYSDFVKNNPDATDIQKSLAQSASIVLGNQTLFSAGSTDPQRLVDGQLRASDLSSIASNSGFGSTLTNAAALWANPGMFAQLETGGQDSSLYVPDGIVSSKNVSSWISQELPSIKDTDIGAFLTDAAMRNLTTNVDISGVGPDVFTDPSKYTGAQKAAALQQLTDLDVKLKGGLDGDSSWDTTAQARGTGINPDPNEVEADVEDKMAELQSDPDVQSYLQQNTPKALQSIASSDPEFQSALQNFYKGDLQSGKAVTDALNGKDTSGNKVTPEEGLQAFMQTADTLTTALGTNGQPLPSLDLQSIVQKSGQVGALQTAYSNDIVSGKELNDALNNGTDLTTAVQQFMSDEANFGAVLPSDFVSNNATQVQQTFSDTISNFLEGQASSDDLTTAFGDSNGNFDPSKVTTAITQVEQSDPSAFTDSNNVPISTAQIISGVNNVVTAMRNGVKLQDALSKLGQVDAPTGTTATAYNAGLLHAVGAVINGGVLAAKTAENHGPGSPSVDASDLGSAMQVMGGLLEGGSKYAKSANITALSGDALKGIESAGKALGGAGSVIGAAVSIFNGVQAIKDGDAGPGALNIASGITNFLSGASSTVEGAYGLADAAGADLTPLATELGFESVGALSASLGATSATLGLVNAGVGVLALVGFGLYEAIEGGIDETKYINQANSVFKKYGITGGDGDSAAPPPLVSDTPPN